MQESVTIAMELKQARRAVTAEAWLTPGRFSLLLAFLVFASFPSVLLGSQSFVFRDFGYFGYPLAFFHRQSFWRGEVPLWNPFNHCGVPFLAQWNTMTLYPPSLIYLLLPMPWSVSFFCLVHLFWGGLGMYFLATTWTQHRLAGSLAGVIFAFNGMMLGSLIWPSQTATLAWMPWVLWLVHRGCQRGGKTIVWGILSGSMQMLAGGPETILFTWCILAAIALSEWFRSRKQGCQIFLRFAGTVLIVALVCSAQLLPFLQLLAHSQRDTDFGSAKWSLPSSGWANFLVPLFHTLPCPWGVCLQEGQGWLSSYYAGVGTIFLAVSGLRRCRDWRPWLIALIMALGFVLAFGDNGHVYRALRACVPGIGFARFPVKFLILTVSLAPLLAAFGFKSLDDNSRGIGRFELGAAAVLLCLIAAVLVISWNEGGIMAARISQNGLTRGAFLVLILLIAGRCVGSQSQKQLYWGGLLLAAFWLDLLTHVPSQNPTVAPSVYSLEALKDGRDWKAEPRLGESRAMETPQVQKGLSETAITSLESNFLIYRMALFMNCNLLEDLPQAYGFFPMVPREINFATYAPFVWTNQNFSTLFDFIGVSQVVSGPDLQWVSRPTPMPTVTIGQKPVFCDDRTALGALAQTNIDLRKSVFLPAEARPEVPPIERTAAQIVSTNFSNQKISVDAWAPEQTMLVVAQTYYPAWKAYVDGKPTRLWRANYAFQAVQVPAGRHHIELRYEDTLWSIGKLLSLAGILLCGGLWLLPGWGKVKEPLGVSG